MSVDKKDCDIDPGSGVGAAPAEDAAAEGSDAKPLRRKSRGLRVPSDNVPRPDQRRTLPPGVRELRRAARRAGLKLRAGETPRELLLRSRSLGLAEPVCQRLHLAAEAHERLRYATARGTT